MIYTHKHHKHGDFGDGFLLLYPFLDGNKQHWNDVILMGCLGQVGKMVEFSTGEGSTSHDIVKNPAWIMA